MMRSPGAPASSRWATRAAASIRCSQLSSATSRLRAASASASVSSSGRPFSSVTPTTEATRETTRSGCCRSPSSTIHTPSGNSSRSAARIRPASRVLPIPPVPHSVSARELSRDARSSPSSRSRPMNRFGSSCRLCCSAVIMAARRGCFRRGGPPGTPLGCAQLGVTGATQDRGRRRRPTPFWVIRAGLHHLSSCRVRHAFGKSRHRGRNRAAQVSSPTVTIRQRRRSHPSILPRVPNKGRRSDHRSGQRNTTGRRARGPRYAGPKDGYTE